MTVCSNKNCLYYKDARQMQVPNKDLRDCDHIVWIDENGKCLTSKEIPEEIEKINWDELKGKHFQFWFKPCTDKINELIDAVNELRRS